MHLLQAQPGEIGDGVEPIDPGQTPADIIVLSAADSELALLSEARAALAERVGDQAPSLRLASLDWLRHPYSVDLYLDDTALKSSLVIARILGGEAYWPYGLEQFSARLGAAGKLFAALPGDDKPDESLFRASSVTREHWERLWAYLVEGGPENAVRFLEHGAHLLGRSEAPAGPSPLLRAGVYWPGAGVADLETVQQSWRPGRPVAAVVFYRAMLQGAGLQPVNRLVKALIGQGLNPLPIFVASLKDAVSAATIAQLFESAPPAVVLNATGFAAGVGGGNGLGEREPTPLDASGRPVLQIVFSSGSEETWEKGLSGLSARDIAMYAALPEVDGRIFTRALSFKGEAYRDEATECPIAAYRARGDRIDFTARLAANWATLGATPASERRVAIVLANYPNQDGRLANGVGLDAPASAIEIFKALDEAGYAVEGAPADGESLMARILAGPTNDLTDRANRVGGKTLDIETYRRFYDALPWALKQAMEERWGAPEADPFVEGDAFRLGVHRYGSVVIGVQPARGYNIDPTETYHSPDLVPPHGYLAFYLWLRENFGAQAVIHLGKHGTLEWLPGKALALSEECWPEAIFGPTPHLYPFIVNDPGEGTQAKRRAQAVVVDHLTPPMTRADTYGPLKDLEGLVDEYYEASGLDPRRREHLAREIVTMMAATGLDKDLGLPEDADEALRLTQLDAHLCEIKESQIRDGLHIFGLAPEGRLKTDLTVALARVPRRGDRPGDASLLRALATDLLGEGFDPLDCDFSAAWDGAKPSALADLSPDGWRSAGDTVERLELLAARLVAGEQTAESEWTATAAVMTEIDGRIRPAVELSGRREIDGLLAGLDDRFVPPGPSGAPTRGRLDVLPTGRNFYSVDSRAIPTPAAWTLGWASASKLIERHLQEEGDWPRAMALTAWGTANMRTGGDDIAQGLALMGVKPRWDAASRRVLGFEVLPLSVLGRPRVDVTLRISGFFRDAFPAQVALFDSAARAVIALDEPEDQNPAAARAKLEAARLVAEGASADEAALRAGYRVFGSKPGAYGAGLQAMIDERLWNERGDLAEAWLDWGGYAYGAGAEGARERAMLETRLARVEAVVQNQDNREHDLLDSDDYYQFEGGLAATVEHLSGTAPAVWHNDHSRPERPVIRRLEEEIARVVRARVVNPKWLAGVKRHGYKGAFEIAATVDYLFAFAATTRAVKDHHFDLVFEAVLGDAEIRDFIEQANPAALREIEARLREAIERGMWTPRSNSARAALT